MGILNKIGSLVVQASHIRPVNRLPIRACSGSLPNGTPVKLVCNEQDALRVVKADYENSHRLFTDVDVGTTLHNYIFLKRTKAVVTEKDLLDVMNRVRKEGACPVFESRMQAQLRYS